MVKLPPIHPGRILLEDLNHENVSINCLARAIRVPANRISLIVNEKRSITADTALRRARFFGTSAEYWLSIQNRYDLACLDRERIQREVLPRRGVNANFRNDDVITRWYA
jgi:antitoxin HigA-1